MVGARAGVRGCTSPAMGQGNSAAITHVIGLRCVMCVCASRWVFPNMLRGHASGPGSLLPPTPSPPPTPFPVKRHTHTAKRHCDTLSPPLLKRPCFTLHVVSQLCTGSSGTALNPKHLAGHTHPACPSRQAICLKLLASYSLTDLSPLALASSALSGEKATQFTAPPCQSMVASGRPVMASHTCRVLRSQQQGAELMQPCGMRVLTRVAHPSDTCAMFVTTANSTDTLVCVCESFPARWTQSPPGRVRDIPVHVNHHADALMAKCRQKHNPLQAQGRSKLVDVHILNLVSHKVLVYTFQNKIVCSDP